MSSQAEICTRDILDVYPNIKFFLAERLGEANWQRYQRISQMPGAINKPHDKGDGDDQFEVTDSLTTDDDDNDDDDEKGLLIIPALPIKEKELGRAFTCTICGLQLVDIKSRADWRKHIFADLEPYLCIFPACEEGSKPYQSKDLWADHEIKTHLSEKNYTCSHCELIFDHERLFRLHLERDHKASQMTDSQIDKTIKLARRPTGGFRKNLTCPICTENLGRTNEAFVAHVSDHLEEISLAAIPREDSDSEYGPELVNQSPIRKTREIGQNVERTPNADPASDEQIFASGTFKFLRPLSKGKHRKVFLAEMGSTKQLVAIKGYTREAAIQENSIITSSKEDQAYNILAKQKHPFITSFYKTFKTESMVYFVTEYVPGGDLELRLQKESLGMEKIQILASEICLALKFLHENDILHRNLKCDNILVAADGHIKLRDFEDCKANMPYGSTTKTFCGGGEYLAPEILLDKPYGRAVDWWGFGVVISQAAIREPLFRGEDEDEIYDAILIDYPLFPISLPTDFVALCQKLLSKEPAERLGSGPTDAQEIMDHEYFKGIVWDDVYNKKVTPPFVPGSESTTDDWDFDPDFASITLNLTPVE